MRRFKPVLSSIVVTLMLATCASKPVKIDSCPAYDAPVAAIKPLAFSTKKVVFLGFTDNTVPVATETGLVNLVESRTNVLASTAGAEIIDATLARDLQEQIRRYEIRGESTYSSHLATDAVRIEIDQAGISSSFQKADSGKAKDGTRWSTPARCTFKGTVTGSLKIYSVNPIMLTETIPIEGKTSNRIDMGNSRCPVPRDTDTALLKEAAAEAASTVKFQKGVLGYFRQVGYVREVRICRRKAKKNFVFLSIPSQTGATLGSDVNFFRQYYFDDRISGARELSKKLIASGKIIETIYVDQAWVQIKDRDDAQQIQIGDVVELIQDPKSSPVIDWFGAWLD
jgi:hypothetical protein